MSVLSRLKHFSRKPALRHGGIVLVDQGFLSFATFITGVLVARSSTKEEYGYYVLGWTLLLIAWGVHRALVYVPFTIYAPRLIESERKTYQGSTFLHTLIISILVALLMLLASELSRANFSIEMSHFYALLPLLAIVTVSYSLRDFIRNALLARLEIWASVVVNIIATATQVALVTWLFIIRRLTLDRAFEILALSSSIAAAYMLWTHRRQMQVVAKRVWEDFLDGLTVGKWLLVGSVAHFGVSHAFPWLLLYFLDPQAVATFGACSTVAGLLDPFLRGASAYIEPRMAHGYKGANTASLIRLLRLSVLALTAPYGLWLAIGSVYGDEIVTLVYSHSYSGFGLLVTLLITKTLIESISTPLGQALQTLERADVITASQVVGAVISLVLGSILISWIGIDGAGITAVISSAAIISWRWVFLRKIVSRSTCPNASNPR
jgi:O-antigen/teichoic acid export membrane protein